MKPDYGRVRPANLIAPESVALFCGRFRGSEPNHPFFLLYSNVDGYYWHVLGAEYGDSLTPYQIFEKLALEEMSKDPHRFVAGGTIEHSFILFTDCPFPRSVIAPFIVAAFGPQQRERARLRYLDAEVRRENPNESWGRVSSIITSNGSSYSN